jgi:hypothetical protein
MPSELRHLIFKPTEVVEAILAHRRVQRLDTPVGTVVKIGILERPENEAVCFGMTIRPDQAGQLPLEIIIQGAELIGMLIVYCRDKNIPVPMRGSKTLVQYGTKIALVITIG